MCNAIIVLLRPDERQVWVVLSASLSRNLGYAATASCSKSCRGGLANVVKNATFRPVIDGRPHNCALAGHRRRLALASYTDQHANLPFLIQGDRASVVI
jgi:hypothetical protein